MTAPTAKPPAGPKHRPRQENSRRSQHPHAASSARSATEQCRSSGDTARGCDPRLPDRASPDRAGPERGGQKSYINPQDWRIWQRQRSDALCGITRVPLAFSVARLGAQPAGVVCRWCKPAPASEPTASCTASHRPQPFTLNAVAPFALVFDPAQAFEVTKDGAHCSGQPRDRGCDRSRHASASPELLAPGAPAVAEVRWLIDQVGVGCPKFRVQSTHC